MKKLGNVDRYKLNLSCLTNQFKVGEENLKNVVAEQKKELEKERHQLGIIYDSVAYFKNKMKSNREERMKTVKKYKGGYVRELEPWEIRLQGQREAFDQKEYLGHVPNC